MMILYFKWSMSRFVVICEWLDIKHENIMLKCNNKWQCDKGIPQFKVSYLKSMVFDYDAKHTLQRVSFSQIKTVPWGARDSSITSIFEGGDGVCIAIWWEVIYDWMLHIHKVVCTTSQQILVYFTSWFKQNNS